MTRAALSVRHRFSTHHSETMTAEELEGVGTVIDTLTDGIGGVVSGIGSLWSGRSSEEEEEEVPRTLENLEAGLLAPLDESISECVRTTTFEAWIELLRQTPGLATYRNKAGHDALIAATQFGRVAIAKDLVRRGLDPAAAGEDGANALHWAIINGSMELAKYYVEECGVDPNSVDANDNTCMHYACCCGQLKILRWLLKDLGCNGAAVNNKGQDCRYFAREKRKRRVLSWCSSHPHLFHRPAALQPKAARTKPATLSKPQPAAPAAPAAPAKVASFNAGTTRRPLHPSALVANRSGGGNCTWSSHQATATTTHCATRHATHTARSATCAAR